MEATFETTTDAATLAYQLESIISDLIQDANTSGWVMSAATTEVARIEALIDDGGAASGLLAAYEDRCAADYQQLGEALALAKQLRAALALPESLPI